MKICIVGDLHFRAALPYADSFTDGRRSEWEAVKQKIHQTASSCDAVVLLGDNLNSKNNASVVLREFIDFLKGFGNKEVHVLCGNHERTGFNTALDFLEKVDHPNWSIYTFPKKAKILGSDAFFIPYVTPGMLGVETKEEGTEALVNLFPKEGTQLCFAHHGFSGSKTGGVEVDLFNEIVIPQDITEKHFSVVFAGHIHQKNQLSEKILLCGSSFTQEVGEYEKSIWVYEETKEGYGTTEVRLPVRGIYKTSWNKEKLDKIPFDSIVKCFVTTRGTDIAEVQEFLKRFDASMVVESYENEREKARFDESMVLDLSIENLLKMLAEAKSINYNDLKEGLDLIKV